MLLRERGANMRAFSFWFWNLTCLLGIACAILELQMIFRIVVLIFVLISLYLYSKYSKCSNCNEYGVNTNPFSKRFGICKNCNHEQEKK